MLEPHVAKINGARSVLWLKLVNITAHVGRSCKAPFRFLFLFRLFPFTEYTCILFFFNFRNMLTFSHISTSLQLGSAWYQLAVFARCPKLSVHLSCPRIRTFNIPEVHRKQHINSLRIDTGHKNGRLQVERTKESAGQPYGQNGERSQWFCSTDSSSDQVNDWDARLAMASEVWDARRFDTPHIQRIVHFFNHEPLKTFEIHKKSNYLESLRIYTPGMWFISVSQVA